MRILKEKEFLLGHFGSINSVVFNHEGKYALSGSDDENLIIWNVSEGKNKHFT